MSEAKAAGEAAVAARPPDGGSEERVVRPEFTATGREYFRVWIVNLFFSIVTLGIYSAWAKVRKKRYFYGSTRFDGDSFDYFASPKAILKGRVIAVALLLAYALLSELFPASAIAFWVAFAAMLPWLIVRSLAFNARNSAYRGLRFDFLASTRDAVKELVTLSVVVVLTLGLAYPWFVARYKSFMLSHHAFGESRMACAMPIGSLFGIYLRAGLLLLLLMIPMTGLIALGVFGASKLPESMAWATFVVPMTFTYGAYAVVYAYTQARTANLQWNNTSGPGMRFSSTLGATKLAWIYLGNIVAVVCSLGLLIPWAVVRTMRYRLENLSMILVDERVHEASPALERVAATGQEVGDIFNLDLGL